MMLAFSIKILTQSLAENQPVDPLTIEGKAASTTSLLLLLVEDQALAAWHGWAGSTSSWVPCYHLCVSMLPSQLLSC